MKAGEELGIETMAINSGWGYWNEDREEAWKRSREMLSRLADEAAKHNINLAMESLRPQESQLVVTLADAKRMHDEVNHPNLKVMIDTTAMGVAGETIDEWFDTFGDEIIHMHFIDGNPYGHLIWEMAIIHLENGLIRLSDGDTKDTSARKLQILIILKIRHHMTNGIWKLISLT